MTSWEIPIETGCYFKTGLLTTEATHGTDGWVEVSHTVERLEDMQVIVFNKGALR